MENNQKKRASILRFVKPIVPMSIDLMFLGFFLLGATGLYASKNICDYAIPLDCYIEYTTIFYCLFALSMGVGILMKNHSWIKVSLIKMCFLCAYLSLWFYNL